MRDSGSNRRVFCFCTSKRTALPLPSRRRRRPSSLSPLPALSLALTLSTPPTPSPSRLHLQPNVLAWLIRSPLPHSHSHRIPAQPSPAQPILRAIASFPSSFFVPFFSPLHLALYISYCSARPTASCCTNHTHVDKSVRQSGSGQDRLERSPLTGSTRRTTDHDCASRFDRLDRLV